jgi:CopG family nickel-responsive transcriptional regulator
MPDIVRFSVSLESDLLDEFDRFCRAGQYETRSEAIRQLLRERLTAAAAEADADATASLTLVYDHHRRNLTERLTELQHDHLHHVVSTMHVHIDHDHCMEVIVLRGKAGKLRRIADQLRGLKGIHQGQLVVAHARADGQHQH